MKRALSALVVGAVAGLMVTAGCGGSERSATEPTTEVDCVVALRRVSPASATLHPGDTLRVVAIDDPCPGLPKPMIAQWASSDTSVATVGASDGLVRARSAGRTTIIASDPADPSLKGAMALVVE